MATIVSKPDVVAFIDYLTGHEDESMNIESVGYEQLPAAIRNSTLQQIMDWQKTGVNCIGIKQKNGRFFDQSAGKYCYFRRYEINYFRL